MAEEKQQLNQQDRSILEDFTKARHLQDLILHPGWKVFLELKDIRLEQAKHQYMTASVDRDALWAMQVRLKGIMQFMDALLEGINNAVETLNPDVMKMILQKAVIDPADMDGDLNLKEEV